MLNKSFPPSSILVVFYYSIQIVSVKISKFIEYLNLELIFMDPSTTAIILFYIVVLDFRRLSVWTEGGWLLSTVEGLFNEHHKRTF